MCCVDLYAIFGCMCVKHTMCMCTWLKRSKWVFVECGNQSIVHMERIKVEAKD